MALEFQNRVVYLVSRVLGATIGNTPPWLIRPGKAEFGPEWERMRTIYSALTQLELPDTMRSVERRRVDAVLIFGNNKIRILEVDETQHFNEFRAVTLQHYSGSEQFAFDLNAWLVQSRKKSKLEGGGFAAPRPPLFPGVNGRHKQRAFRDAICDLLPPIHDYAPTLRIADFEVKNWIWDDDAESRMATFLSQRLSRSI